MAAALAKGRKAEDRSDHRCTQSRAGDGDKSGVAATGGRDHEATIIGINRSWTIDHGSA